MLIKVNTYLELYSSKFPMMVVSLTTFVIWGLHLSNNDSFSKGISQHLYWHRMQQAMGFSQRWKHWRHLPRQFTNIHNIHRCDWMKKKLLSVHYLVYFSLATYKVSNYLDWRGDEVSGIKISIFNVKGKIEIGQNCNVVWISTGIGKQVLI